MSYFEILFFFLAKKSNEEESDSSTALCVQEQMEAAYCLLMKVTVFGPSCGEDRTSCATRELQNRAACPVTEKPTQRAALRKAQEANLVLWCKGTIQPESECLPVVVAFSNPCKTSGASNSHTVPVQGGRVKLLSQQHRQVKWTRLATSYLKNNKLFSRWMHSWNYVSDRPAGRSDIKV